MCASLTSAASCSLFGIPFLVNFLAFAGVYLVSIWELHQQVFHQEALPSKKAPMGAYCCLLTCAYFIRSGLIPCLLLFMLRHDDIMFYYLFAKQFYFIPSMSTVFETSVYM